LLFALTALAVLGRAGAVQARAAGFATASCDSCHRGGGVPKVTISMDPLALDPGGTTTVTVTVTAVNGGPAGFYLHSRGQGTFMDIPGEGTRLPTPTDVVLAMPKRGGDTVTFRTKWTAPAMAGSYSFEAWGVSANGNNQPTGDGAAGTNLFFTVGCTGMTVYVDFDGDGYGSDAIQPQKACDLQPGFVLKGGDCNDYVASVHPGAPEICDEYDNNCDGQVNEGLENAIVYRDNDGDGHASRTTSDMRVGCAPGYTNLRDDCNDSDKDVYPGAKEICNNKDDNCNGRVDEGARLTCGTGWCRVVADTCNATSCTPGSPRPEQCNLIDDDCDGVIDNDAPCENGRVCVLGRCLAPDDARAIREAMDGGAPDAAHSAPTQTEPDGGEAPSSADRRRERPAGCQQGGGPEASRIWLLLLAGGLWSWRRRRGSSSPAVDGSRGRRRPSGG
jgi:MYXO-CTERM domain-containing protein